MNIFHIVTFFLGAVLIIDGLLALFSERYFGWWNNTFWKNRTGESFFYTRYVRGAETIALGVLAVGFGFWIF